MTRAKSITIPTLTCLHCGHIWVPSKSEPKVCPKCKRYNWNEAPKAKSDGQ